MSKSKTSTVASSPQVLSTLKWIRSQGQIPVPVVYGDKMPAHADYLKPDYKPEDDTWSNNRLNIGMRLGPKFGAPVDIDLDCPEAVLLAPHLLPPSEAIFGRKGNPRTHYLYVLDSQTPEQPRKSFSDPSKDLEKTTLIEIRGDLSQTVLPGSVYENSKKVDPIVWASGKEPSTLPVVSGPLLLRSVKNIAAASLILRYFWVEGSRNDFSRYLSGALFYRGFTIDEATSFVQAIMEAADDDDMTRLKTLNTAYKKAENGDKIQGFSTIRKEYPSLASVIDRLSDYLGDEMSSYVEDFNAEFAVVNLEGRTRVAYTPKSPGDPISFANLDDFHAWTAPRLLSVGEGKFMPASKAWLKNAKRRTYDGVAFLPGQTESNNLLNLWTGWQVDPTEDYDTAVAGCSGWVELLRETVCGGDKVLGDWMVNWFAGILQRPMDKPLTAPVIRGIQGAGKTLLVEYFSKILGPYYVAVTDPEHLHGKFNSHTASALLLHSEEAIFSKDPRHKGVIKSLITDKYRTLERKGIDPVPVINCIRLILTSNNNDAVAAEHSERRYTIIDMAKRKADQSLIDKVRAEYAGDGPKHLMRYLLNWEYDAEMARTNIKNDDLMNSKLANLRGFGQWWYECLQDGELLPDNLKWAQKGNDPWPTTFSTEAMFYSARRVAKSLSPRYSDSKNTFFLELYEFLGVRSLPKERRIFANPRPENADPDIQAMKSRTTSFVSFPSLEQCRKAFEAYLGYPVEWPDGDKPAVELDEDKGHPSF